MRRRNYKQAVPVRQGQRREKPSFRHRFGRLLWQLGIIALMVSVALVAWLVYRSPLMQIREVSVTGTESLDPRYVASLSGLRGQSLLRVDTGAARDRLLALPAVKDVSISKQWPGKMLIRVEERHPWGYWQIKDQPYVIDDEGVVLDDLRPDENAPVIFELDTERRLAAGDHVDADAVMLSQELIDESPRALNENVAKLEYSQHSGLTVTFDSGLRAIFGDSRDLDYKLSVLYVLLDKAQGQSLAVHDVDLRFGENVSFQ